MFDPADYPDLLVGLNAPDDAAVLRLDDQRALIFTTDFFTPIVDDPYHYGAIAAANSLSDIYAMGGKPVLALNIAAFPNNLPLEILSQILQGMADKAKEAGVVIAGGHTIQDREPKVGLAAIGFVDIASLLTKGGAQIGDPLILTKPLGTGIIATAGKNDQVDPADLAAAITWMSLLNAQAARAAIKAGAHAMTDVTGFGLIGHASEMLRDESIAFEIQAGSLPLMQGAERYARQGIFPGGSAENRAMYESSVDLEEGISPELRMLLFDAQTSGGLLIALPEAGVNLFKQAMESAQQAYWQIGRVIARADRPIHIID
jgi:selenide,water dikinase